MKICSFSWIVWILSHSRSNHRWISCSNHKGKYHEWHEKYLTENYWCWMRSSFVVCCPCFSLSLSLIFHFIKIFNFNSKECNGFKLWRRIFFKMLVFILNVAPTHKLAGAWFCTSDSQLRVLGFCIVLAFFSAGQLHLEICIALTTLHLMRTSIYAVKLMNRFIVFFLSLFIFLALTPNFFTLRNSWRLNSREWTKRTTEKRLKSEDL